MISKCKKAARRQTIWTALDILLIAAMSFVAQATHFSYKQGRVLICGDSTQYVASAEALLTPGKTPHFEMRKPGYILFLAGVSALLGNMGWAVVAGQHVLLGMLPLAAYGLGRHLKSRLTGWLAAVLTTAQLQALVWGDRMLSEALFTCLFSFGLLLFVVALSRDRSRRLMVGAGTLLGLAWLTRGSAAPVLVAAVAAILVTNGRHWRGALAMCAAFGAPVTACVIVECGLNLAYAGQFRPSNGTVGATILLRARHFEGMDLPPAREAKDVLALLPERDRDSAYVADLLDLWVARYRALHDRGMDEWAYDDMMRRVGWSALSTNFGAYVKSSLGLSLCHLLRRPDGQALSPVSADQRAGPIIHPAAPAGADWDTSWFAYYGLPHMTPAESMTLVERMKSSASQRAPVGDSSLWKTLRYWKTKKPAEGTLAGLRWLGSLCPVIALLGGPFLGLNRRACIFLATAFALDALFIGFFTPTNSRLQFIWLAIDTSLVAAATVGVAGLTVRLLRRPSRGLGRACPQPI